MGTKCEAYTIHWQARRRPPHTAKVLPALLFAMLVMLPNACGDAKPVDFLPMLDAMEHAYAQVDHYTATFLIQERHDGVLNPEQVIELKFKKPFRVYMHWVKGKNKGRQAIYPAGADGTELWVRVPWLLGAVTVSLDPQGSRAKQGSRHSITDVGIGRLLEFIGDNARRGLQRGEARIKGDGQRTTFERTVHRYILYFPKDPALGYYCMTAVIDVDSEQRLPIYAEIWDWSNELVERYGYLDLHLNPGLTMADFDPKNPAYGF